MRVQTEEWRRFTPGVRMYKGKKTLFYNGEPLWEGRNVDGHPRRIYDWKERDSWEVIIVLPGVELIPNETFSSCENLKTVIMADSLKRIEEWVFNHCYCLEYVKLSNNLEYIGYGAFQSCSSLSSVFIPPSCREIDYGAFWNCKKLIIFVVPQHTQLGEDMIGCTALIEASLFELNENGDYESENSDEVNEWIKNTNGNTDEYALHRACSSYNPFTEIIYQIVKRQGLEAFHKKNEIGITPFQYLDTNPFADISQSAIMKRYVLEMMGEAV
ncbi:leucine-rich repeat domain-containing protein [Chaetoceros tenuissimus]|uniref:Leucine-rich repeat domain-containing protein n=1 Tax=Chaetoceros tenuissimus TaxID=426638 RepID=A0AAD3CGZ4_9STRA|nr:leucine-rich repeat domain-containing protein [Chaetoceros tenuissimus]